MTESSEGLAKWERKRQSVYHFRSFWGWELKDRHFDIRIAAQAYAKEKRRLRRNRRSQ